MNQPIDSAFSERVSVILRALKWAKPLYWKLCFGPSISLFPLRANVVDGPFRGMRYAFAAQGSYISTKILGTYEKELHGIVQEIQRLAPDHIVNIGAGEGYYAVGLGRGSRRGQRITCFELDERGRVLLQTIAGWNLVSNLEIKGRCEIADLKAAVRPSTSGHERIVVICDVEGYESVLLDPKQVEGLRGGYILVETHDDLVHGVTDLLVARFEATHKITHIRAVNRQWEDFPKPNFWASALPRSLALRAMGEGRRLPQGWIWMTPIPTLLQ